MKNTFVRLVFDGGFNQRDAEEAVSGGYRSHVWAELQDGSLHRLTFYDPVRLSQMLEDETVLGRPFVADQGLIVVREVTRENMEFAVRLLVEEGFFKTKGHTLNSHPTTTS